MRDWHQQLHLPITSVFWDEGYRIPLFIYDIFYAATSAYIALQGRITDDDELEGSWMERVIILQGYNSHFTIQLNMLLCYIHPVFFNNTLPPTCFSIQWAINRETNTREHFCEYATTLENTIYASLGTKDTAALDTVLVYSRVQYQYTVFTPAVHFISYHYRMRPLNKNWWCPIDTIFRQGIPLSFDPVIK